MAIFGPLDAPTQFVSVLDGASIAYRVIGAQTRALSDVPLVLHIHFRGNMDFWDPALINTLSQTRPVVIFDHPGIGRSISPNAIPTTFQGWANDLIAFVDALGFKQIDLFGFSMGGMAVQMVALTRPDLVRKLVLGGTSPSAPGPGWSEAEVGRGLVWPREESGKDAFLAFYGADGAEDTEEAEAKALFYQTDAGKRAATEYMARLKQREASGEGVNLQLLGRAGAERQLAALQDFGVPNARNSFDRLAELKMPVLIQNGDDDLLIPTSRSWELARRIKGAKLIIYPYSGHGYLWQYPEAVGKDINDFLDG